MVQKSTAKYHLLDHADLNLECVGCQAKARNKKHIKGAFNREDHENEHVVSLDQVGMSD